MTQHELQPLRPTSEGARDRVKAVTPPFLRRLRRVGSLTLRHPGAAIRAMRHTGQYTAHGVRVAVPRDLVDGATRIELEAGTYEKPEAVLVERFVTGLPVAVEVGAGIGVITQVLARAVGPEGVVHAVEANPLAVATLRENTARLQHVHVEHAAAGVGDGLLTFVRAASVLGGSTTSGVAAGQTYQVPVFDVGAALSSAGGGGLVVDIEGAELELLPSLAEEGQLDGVQALVVEWHPRMTGWEPVEATRRVLVESGMRPAEHIGQVEAWVR